MMINCAGFLDRSRVNGPGERTVLWVQGCPLRCPGCFNQPLWSFKKNHLVSVEDIAARIISIPGIDGVTFSGGEPFCQALPLAELGTIICDEGLSVVTFSGFSADTLLCSRRKPWKALLRVTDLLVAGPYLQEFFPGTSFCGSSNQKLVHLSTRIPPESLRDKNERNVEFTIGIGGEITTTGFPKKSFFHGERGCT